MNRSRHDWRSQAYDETHPEIWARYEIFGVSLFAEGWRKIGPLAMLGIIRQPPGYNPIKVSHNYAPYYARKFNAYFPECAGLIGG